MTAEQPSVEARVGRLFTTVGVALDEYEQLWKLHASGIDIYERTHRVAVDALADLEVQFDSLAAALEREKVEVIEWKLAKADSDRELERAEREKYDLATESGKRALRLRTAEARAQKAEAERQEWHDACEAAWAAIREEKAKTEKAEAVVEAARIAYDGFGEDDHRFYGSQLRLADALTAYDEPPTLCEHEWIDARNAAVESGEFCVKCHAMRAPWRS